MEYPVRRDLDGCFFRVNRDSKWLSLCWTDLTTEERENIMEEKDVYWHRRMLEYITNQFRIIGDHFDIVNADDDED